LRFGRHQVSNRTIKIAPQLKNEPPMRLLLAVLAVTATLVSFCLLRRRPWLGRMDIAGRSRHLMKLLRWRWRWTAEMLIVTLVAERRLMQITRGA
jgi:hypothetical protein